MRNLFIILVCFSFCTSKQKQANQLFKKEATNLKQDTLKYYASFDIHAMQPVGKSLKGEVHSRCISFERKKDTIILNMYREGMFGNVHERIYTKDNNEYVCYHKVNDAGLIIEIHEFINAERVLSFHYFISNLQRGEKVYQFKKLGEAVQIKNNEAIHLHLEDQPQVQDIKIVPYKDIEGFIQKYNIPKDHIKKTVVTPLNEGKVKIDIIESKTFSYTIDDYDYFWYMYLRLWAL